MIFLQCWRKIPAQKITFTYLLKDRAHWTLCYKEEMSFVNLPRVFLFSELLSDRHLHLSLISASSLVPNVALLLNRGGVSYLSWSRRLKGSCYKITFLVSAPTQGAPSLRWNLSGCPRGLDSAPSCRRRQVFLSFSGSLDVACSSLANVVVTYHP